MKNRHQYLILCIGLLLSWSRPSTAQKLTFELEADPIAYIFQGYSLHTILNKGHWRYSMGVFGIKQPDFFVSNKNFDVYTQGIDAKIDYILREDTRGFFVGAQVNYAREKVSQESLRLKNIDGLNFGPRIGYRYFISRNSSSPKGLYIAPWVALLYATNQTTVQSGDQVYDPSPWTIFPTVHLGWRF
jgi:hypothetical protein